MPVRFLIVGGWDFIFSYLEFAGCYWLMSPHFPDWLIVAVASVLGITNSFIFHPHLRNDTEVQCLCCFADHQCVPDCSLVLGT